MRFTARGHAKVGLDPLLFLNGHLQGDALGVLAELVADLLLEHLQALLGPDGVQHALLAGGAGGRAQLRREDGGQGVKLEGIALLAAVARVRGRLVGQRDDGGDGDAGGQEEVEAAGVLAGLLVGGQDGLLALPRDVPRAGGFAGDIVVLPLDHKDLGALIALAGLELEAREGGDGEAAAGAAGGGRDALQGSEVAVGGEGRGLRHDDSRSPRQ